MKINRIAVSVFFLVNGFLSSNWAARLPELQDYLHVSHSELGTILFIAALGAMTAMPFIGWLTVKLGSRTITRVTGLLYAVSAGLLALFQDPFYAGIFFFFLGMAAGSLDVSMNAQAVFVENAWGKPIMSSFHAIFSVGLAVGAGTGALFAKLDTPLLQHFIIIATVSFLLNLWAGFNLIADAVHTATSQSSGFQLPTKAILPIGIIAFCCMTGESSVADWSAIFMRKVFATDDALSALAFVVFSVLMTIGRLMGDHLTLLLGRKNILMLDGFLATFGLSLVVFAPHLWVAIIGFAFVGFGLSTIVPVVYSIAGNTNGVSPSAGIAMATTIGYAGFFVGPPVIGYLSDAFNLRVGLSFTLFLSFVMMFFILKSKFRD